MASSKSSVRGLSGLRRQRAAQQADLTANVAALQARMTLSNARSVTLLVAGIGTVGADGVEDPVSLLDLDGVPTFLCDAGSRIASAAGRDAILSVPGRAGTTLAMLGRLETAGVQEVDGAVVDVVHLAPRSIVLERDDPALPLGQHVVPLSLYLDVKPDRLCEVAERILRHGNHAHESQLRAAVARHQGIAADSIAAATLTWLDPEGAELRWVDAEGSHLLWLPFPAPATTPDLLAENLRRRLA